MSDGVRTATLGRGAFTLQQHCYGVPGLCPPLRGGMPNRGARRYARPARLSRMVVRTSFGDFVVAPRA